MTVKHNSLHQLNFFTFCIISVAAVLFGYWFATMQLKAVAMDAISLYPKQYFMLTIFKSYLAIIAFFTFSQLMLSQLSLGKIKSSSVAWSYLPVILVYVHCPLYWIGCLILLIQAGLLVAHLQRNDYQQIRHRYSTDLLVFLFFLICHFFLTSRFSPLQWNASMLTAHGYNSEEIPVLVPIFQGYLLAKQFVFSNFDHAQWAGIMYAPVTLASPFMQLIDFIFDFPSVSYEGFHQLYSTIYFILMVAGSFGFYLFLKYAAKINSVFASFGGFLFLFSGNPLLSQMFTSDGGIFLAPLVLFPYALLCISNAFEKNDYRFAAWGGLAVAAQFFFLTPHPEGTFYSIFFYGVYTMGLFLFSWQLSWIRRFFLAVVSIIALFALSAFYIIPIVYDQMNGNMFVFAHTNDINFTYFLYFKVYVGLLAVFSLLSLFLLFLYKKITPVYLSSLFLSIVLLAFVFIILDANLISMLVHFLHMGIHFWVPSRIGVYFYASVFIITMYGLDILARLIFDLIKNKRIVVGGGISHE